VIGLPNEVDELAANLAGRRAVVTGASGLIGGRLMLALARARVEAVGIDLRVDDCDRATRGVDVRDRGLVAEVIADAGLVFHEAAIKVPACDRDPWLGMDVLVAGTLNVARACANAGARLVFASTGAIYGAPERMPISEDQPVSCASFYAAAKAACEHALEAAAALWGLHHVSLRYFSVYGAGMVTDGPDAEVLGRWSRQIVGGRAPVVYGSGRQLRDFTHVADAVQANLRAALRAPDGACYNVGTGEGITLLDAANLLAAVARVEVTPATRPDQPGGPMQSVPDITRMREELGYMPAVRRPDGFRELVDWVRDDMESG